MMTTSQYTRSQVLESQVQVQARDVVEADEDDDGVLSIETIDIVVVHAKLDLADGQYRLEKTLHVGGCCGTNLRSRGMEHNQNTRVD